MSILEIQPHSSLWFPSFSTLSLNPAMRSILSLSIQWACSTPISLNTLASAQVFLQTVPKVLFAFDMYH